MLAAARPPRTLQPRRPALAGPRRGSASAPAACTVAGAAWRAGGAGGRGPARIHARAEAAAAGPGASATRTGPGRRTGSSTACAGGYPAAGPLRVEPGRRRPPARACSTASPRDHDAVGLARRASDPPRRRRSTHAPCASPSSTIRPARTRTRGPSRAAVVRAIQLYHVRGNGWNDIGYNFLVDRYGQVFEGRFGGVERNVVGAHAQGFNTGSVGVALLGNYNSTRAERRGAQRAGTAARVAPRRRPRRPARRCSRGRRAETRASRPASPSSCALISGHRDVGFTSCPGNGRLRPAQPSSRVRLRSPACRSSTPRRPRPSSGQRAFHRPAVDSDSAGRSPSSDPLGTTGRAGRAASARASTGPGTRASFRRAAYSLGDPRGPDAPAGDRSIVAGGRHPRSRFRLLSAQPATVSPNGDGFGDATTIRYTLGAPATVTATVLDDDGVALATLFNEARPAGAHAFRWLPTRCRTGATASCSRRRRSTAARSALDRAGVGQQDALVRLVDPGVRLAERRRALDRARVSFTLAADADVQRHGVRPGGSHRDLLAGRPRTGRPRCVDWDGMIAGVPTPDGTYELSSRPRRRSGSPRSGRSSLSTQLRRCCAWCRLRGAPRDALEPATVTSVVDGRSGLRPPEGRALPHPRHRARSARPRLPAAIVPATMLDRSAFAAVHAS